MYTCIPTIRPPYTYHRAYTRIMARPSRRIWAVSAFVLRLPVNDGLLVGLARQRVGMTAVRRMGRPCVHVLLEFRGTLMMGTRRLLGRAAESIAGRERLVSWLFRWLGWDGLA